jgi:hypothetical protein
MTSRLQKLLSLSLTQLGLYLNLIPSTTRTPLDLLGSSSYLILISSTTRIHMMSLLNRTYISLMLPCVYWFLIQSKEDLLSLLDALHGRLTHVFTHVLTRVIPKCLTRSSYSYPALPDLLTRSGNSLSPLSRNLLPEPIACQHYVLQTQLSPCRPNLVYTLPGRQPIFTFTGLLPDLAYLADNPFFASSDCDFTFSLLASYLV